ncbi:MAG: hypothetical protein JWL76_578 [Thermoleophilia bacterium]|nr:hypothetical protein [Thermoleophilia bacterium]
MTALWTLLTGFVLAAGAWQWSTRSIDGSARVAIVAVLGVTAAAFNIVVPIPSVEATTTIVLCASIALGARTGIAAGLVAIVASSVTGGVGVWTIWQVVAVAVVGIVGAVAARFAVRELDWFTQRSAIVLVIASVVATSAYDVITTVGSLASYAPQGGTLTQRIVGALLIGAMFTVTHVVFTTMFTVVGGPPLLHALGRARPRLAGGVVTA